jgi:hypothetical protein
VSTEANGGGFITDKLRCRCGLRKQSLQRKGLVAGLTNDASAEVRPFLEFSNWNATFLKRGLTFSFHRADYPARFKIYAAH